ncbi:hypothetical protein U1Q18_006054 [Sarracenia purpurea var. burkii]
MKQIPEHGISLPSRLSLLSQSADCFFPGRPSHYFTSQSDLLVPVVDRSSYLVLISTFVVLVTTLLPSPFLLLVLFTCFFSEVSLCGFLLPCAILSDLVSVFRLVFSVCFLGFSLYAYRSCPRPESYWYFSPLRGGSSIVPVAGIATPLCATFAFTGGSEWLFLEDFLRSDPEACSLAALLDGKGGRFWLLQLPSAPRWLDLPTRLRDLRASCA